MSFEYQTNIDAVVQVLKDHNSAAATPFLSLSLSTVFLNDNITANDPEIVNIHARNLPAIFVRVSRKDHDFGGIGSPGTTSARVKQEATVKYDVIAFYSKNTGRDSYPEVLQEIYKVARNIEGVFSQEYSLSGTALWCRPVSTDFFPPLEIDGSWIKAVLIELEAKYLFR